MMSKDSVLDYIKNKELGSDGTAKISLYIMKLLLETEDCSIVRFKLLIAKALKNGISNPALFEIYKDVIEFIGG